MENNIVLNELHSAYSETQSVIDRVCAKLDEMNIKQCELLETLNIKHSYCDGVYSFKLRETTSSDIVEMKYDGEHLIVEYFDESGSRGLPQQFNCPTAGTLLREILYAINYSKVLSESLAYLIYIVAPK